MALVARISARSGKTVRTIALRKGVNVLAAGTDAIVSVIDEATGKTVDQAQLVRHGDEISISVPDSYFAATQSATGDAAPGGASQAGADAPSDPGTSGGESGGGSGLTYGIIGGLALAGGLAAAAGGGGGSDGNAPAADTTAPAAPSGLALAAADDTGASNSDRITSQTSGLTISGTAEANSTVTIKEGATTVATGTANASGAFSIDVSLAAGVHNLTATATDAAGNASTASTALSVTVDTTAPTVAITSSAASLLGAQTATLTFTFSEAPTGFTAGDIAVTGGTIGNLAVSVGDPKVYTATLTPTATQAGNLSVSVASGAFADTAGNNSTAAASLNLAFDPGDSGQAIDGYIAHALVFRDADNDGAWDHESFTDANNNGLRDQGESYVDANNDGAFTAEFATQTDDQGNFSNLFGSGRIVLAPLFAGDGTNRSVDISTGLAFTGKLSAPDGSTVVTPLTTIVEALAGTGASAAQIAAAQAQVKTALGLDASVDITSFDPIAVAGSSNDVAALANAVAVQKAAVQVANILTVMASASEAAGATGGAQAGLDAAVDVIAGQIGANGAVDLTDPALVGEIVQAVADASGNANAASALEAQSDALSASLANVNSAVEQASGDGVVNTFAAIVTTQIVAQETLANDVGTAIENNAVLDETGYQGAALENKIDEAAAQVEVVIPTEQPAGALGEPLRPTVEEGPRISGAEVADGVVVSVSYAAATGVAAGDTLKLTVGGVEVKSVLLTAADIPAAGSTGTISFTLSAGDLGADGAKTIAANFVSAAGTAGAVSLPAIVTLDTAIEAPAGLALAAADDTGVSSTDRVTGQASGLTVTGTAEANAAVVLKEGDTTLGTGTADGSGNFSIDIALAQGAHSVSATATDTAGNVSAVSGALAITVDSAAPAAPSGLALSEGPLLSAVEAADGTTITGATEAGSSVRLTLTNGDQTLIKDAQVSGTAFTVALTAAEVAQLGEGYVKYSAVATDAAGNAGLASATGQYLYTTQPIAAPNVRIDSLDTPVVNEDDSGVVSVTPLHGGGFAVHWIVDANHDGDGDAIAIQRFAADGSKDGGITVLQGIAEELAEDAGDGGSYDLTALANGGYALSYVLAPESTGRSVTMSQQLATAPIVGRPTDIFISSAPDNATFSLVGRGNDGSPQTVVLTREDSSIQITKDILDQFDADNRLTLFVNGLTQGQTASVFIGALADVHYDAAAGLQDVAFNGVVSENGIGVLGTPFGRSEAFRIDEASGTPSFVVMHVTPSADVSVNLAGIPGASLLPNGSIQIAGLTPDGNGFYGVPQAILAQIGEHDFNAILILGGLAAGSAVEGTLSVRDAIPNPEGVHVQTFDANGAAVTPEGIRIDGPNAPSLGEEEDRGVNVTAFHGGGFAVNWVVDADGDREADGLAVQRFAADGSKQGDVVLMQGVTEDLLEHVDEVGSFDMQTLAGGGHVLTYSLALERTFSQFTLMPQVSTAAIIGRPTDIVVNGPAQNVTYSLIGIGNDGLSKTVNVTPVDGRIAITQDILDQFGVDNRISLSVTGLAQGQTVSAIISGLADVRYDTSAPLHDAASNWVVQANGLGIVAVAEGRPEAFHIDMNAGAPTFVSMQISLPFNGAQIDLTGVPGAQVLPNGAILVANVAADANGLYKVPPAILSQIGEQDFQAVLILGGQTVGGTVTGTVSVRDAIPNPEGVFVHTFDANGAPVNLSTERLDDAASRIPQDEVDEASVRVTPLDDGGFAVNWVVDADGDGETDGLAVQRLAADGSKVGGIVMLDGISSNLLANTDDGLSYDLQALDSGGYVLTYSVHMEDASRYVPIGGQAGPSAQIAGRPLEIDVSGAPANATFTLFGAGLDGLSKSIALTPANGVIPITQAILDQFAVDNRFTLVAGGLAQTVGVVVQAVEDVRYDPSAATHDVTRSFLVGQNGSVGISGGLRTEAVYIDAASGVPTSVSLLITPAHVGSINTATIPNVTFLANGSILIGGLASGADGYYRVPETILEQLGSHDAQFVFIANGLAAGSSLTATASIREPIPAPDGVYVQTFDANGHALSESLHLTGTAGADTLLGGAGDDVLTGGEGHDVLTGGQGSDLFVLDAPGGQTLALADLVTDFHVGTDHLQLPGGIQFSDLTVVQGDPGTNGAAATDSLIVYTASGDILAHLANTEAATITQASFL